MASAQVRFIDASSEELKRFRGSFLQSVDQLKKITPSDKALAVPYVKIREIDPKTGLFVGDPITTSMFTPARFGESAQTRFPERPAASLESITVKTTNPVGLFVYRELDISFVVHRPELIFSDDKKISAWSSLIYPGRVHLLEYGWSGGNNPVLGVGPNKGRDDLEDPKSSLKARELIRFVISNYSFSVSVDGQVHVHVKAFEDGELYLRNSGILDQEKASELSTESKNDFDEQRKQLVASIADSSAEVSLPSGKKIRLISFNDLMRVLFEKPMKRSFGEIGCKRVDVKIGSFNRSCPRSSSVFAEQKCADQQIGSFGFPVDIVERILESSMKKDQMSTYSVLRRIIEVFSDFNGTWQNDPNNRPVDVPDVQMRVSYTGGEGHRIATIWIIDLKHALSTMKDGLNQKSWTSFKLGSLKTSDDVKSFTSKNSIPLIKLGSGDSYVSDCRFEVVQDPLAKSIMMRRSLLSRDEIATDQPKNDELQRIPNDQLLYRSAIKGHVTMLGNFAFEVFNVVWVDFGVRAWNGLFWVREKVDKIESGNFSSTIDLIAEGSDPLASSSPPAQSGKSPPKKE